MNKFGFLLIIIGVFGVNGIKAQSTGRFVLGMPVSDTLGFYMNHDDRVADSIGNAEYIRFICPPDIQVNKFVNVVKDFYMNGKLKLIGCSLSNSEHLILEGSCVEYFLNGHRKSIKTYSKGVLIGDEFEYYANGKLYRVKKHTENNDIVVSDCADSTGMVLAENGNGKYIKYDIDLRLLAEGPIVNGKEDGEWIGIDSTGTKHQAIYKNGKLISGDLSMVTGNKIYKGNSIDNAPGFIGGDSKFGRYLGASVRYPASARENNIQGRVIISFIVEKDGALSNFKIEHKVDSELDKEALRVLKSSPKWSPAFKDGLPVRIKYSVPVQFALAN